MTLVVIALIAGSAVAFTPGDPSHGSPFIGEPSHGDPFHGHPSHGDPFIRDPSWGNPCRGGGCQPVCGPYKTDVKNGYLSQGQRATTGYYIPGYRSYIEWILTGPCGNEVIPMTMMSGDGISSLRTRYCGTDFDLIIYQNHNSGHFGGYADYKDIGGGANAYVGVSYPVPGSTYYAQVYARSGSGHYTLTCRSYTCHDDAVMMMENPVSTMMDAATPAAPLSLMGNG